MMRRIAIFMILLLLLTGAVLAQAQVAIEGLSETDLALLTSASEGMDADTLHFDMTLDVSVDGAPEVDLEVSLSGPAAFGTDDDDQPLMTMDLEGTTSTGTDEETPLIVRLRLVDGVLYLLTGAGEAWQGMAFDDSLSSSGLDLTQVAGAQALDFLGWLESAGLSEFSSGERLEDEDGRANFHIEVDLGAWLTSPALADLLALVGETTDDESLAAIGPLLGMFLDDLLLELEPVIEIDGGLMRQLTLELGMSVNAAVLGGSSDADPTAISITLLLENMRYNEPLEVTVPEGEVTFNE